MTNHDSECLFDSIDRSTPTITWELSSNFYVIVLLFQKCGKHVKPRKPWCKYVPWTEEGYHCIIKWRPACFKSFTANQFATPWLACRTATPFSIYPPEHPLQSQRRHLLSMILDLSRLSIASTFVSRLTHHHLLILVVHSSAQSSALWFLNPTFSSRSLWRKNYILHITLTHIWARLSIMTWSQRVAVLTETVGTRLGNHVTFLWSIPEEI